ncbi:MAG: tRNA dihydrouridine synthase DusB [Planctomycetes bacterium]|nr:tRNA dihydrouridine synthase DusB [Planctomycetota bacterium]MBT4028446.1 tRNA dihydrouridine synthase DusB [Planctomycetota bacterium]MBT4559683.1 tRNA dihydrouridine synthase DusB [Planctomycetota bacterium]MBT5100744.1 tRNA dihydrouridine synthase DusB [Planctomycetota bacterium]MBT5119964.1 tRNA dihydrouridine synthase DusB [Planctomycetota bacterium]
MTATTDLSNIGFELGPFRVVHGLALAPMAGNTNLAYRRLCKKFGAELTCTEMVSSRALEFGDAKSLTYLERGKEEEPVVAQIFGASPETLAIAVQEVEKRGFHAIDLNMGCPVPKITGSGGGSSLLRDPDLAARCIESMVAHSGLPITAKIRAGWDSANKNAPAFAHQLQEAGAAVITIHGRTRAQKYMGEADLDIIAETAARCSIPVIGNGDITDVPSAMRMFATGVNGIAIGRGALGKPWIFRQIRAALQGEDIPKAPTANERASILLELGEGIAQLYGEKRGMLVMRRLASDFFKGLPGSAKARAECIKLKSLEDLHRLAEWLNSNP